MVKHYSLWMAEQHFMEGSKCRPTFFRYERKFTTWYSQTLIFFVRHWRVPSRISEDNGAKQARVWRQDNPKRGEHQAACRLESMFEQWRQKAAVHKTISWDLEQRFRS